MKRIFTLCLSLATLGAIAQNTQKTAAAFGAGNLVVFRAGDGSAALSNVGTAAFLDEYTVTGTLVQSIALPTTASGSNKRLICSGTATSEGMIQRSTDGAYLLVTGYDAALATASITSSASASVNRTVARVNSAGVVDASTSLTDFSDGSNPRSIISTNGTDMWGVGGAGGVRYFTYGSTTSTQISTTSTNIRAIDIFGGQLYISTGSGSLRVASVGTGLPTVAGQTITQLPSFPTTGSPYQFWLADLSAAVPGPDVLYVADDASGTGIQKYSLVAGSWVANGSVAVTGNGARGITGSVAGSVATLYIANGTNIFSLVDATGYNVTIAATSPTSIATAATNTAFRGLDFAPGSVVPLSMQSFTASLVGGKASLAWSSINEINVSGFAIEKSKDGKSFTQLDFVAAKNASTNSYSYTDAVAATGTTYYRLKITDKDGSFKYSAVVALNAKQSISLDVFPNPVSSTAILSHTKANNGATIKVLSIEGKKLMQYSVQAGATQSSIDVSRLVKGNYLVVFENAGTMNATKFIKQ